MFTWCVAATGDSLAKASHVKGGSGAKHWDFSAVLVTATPPRPAGG